MKKLILSLSVVLGVLLFAGLPTEAVAQKSKKEQKAEKKRWKKIAKNYKKNPLALKAKEEAYQKQIEALTQKNNELTERYTELQAELDNLEANARRCQTSLDSARSEYDRLQQAFELLKEQQTKMPESSGIPGLVFRVQIGAYEKFDMSRFAGETGDNFTGESMAGLNKYLIGRFRGYETAQAFRDDIRRLGIRDAFVVAYSDGTRIDIKRALEMQNGGSSTSTPIDVPADDNGGSFDNGGF